MKKFIYTFAFILISTLTFAQAKTYQLSSHILDVSKGMSAAGVPIKLEQYNSANKTWNLIDEKITDTNGRIPDFLSYDKGNLGIYKLTFATSEYFKKDKIDSFYPFIEVVFEIKDSNHYHVPITLSAFGYSTYRGN
ncbi:hydroxyisourate hydrolase [Flavobacterium tegetincola]|uniref:hydroxyisourate hydrolase n=1 Tax=Flavobacterium tegetincola TaxID=150172 RepID=UPI0004242243|nr:hydroxyisourate hydrolase [Flavobacterium tegetincola]